MPDVAGPWLAQWALQGRARSHSKPLRAAFGPRRSRERNGLLREIGLAAQPEDCRARRVAELDCSGPVCPLWLDWRSDRHGERALSRHPLVPSQQRPRALEGNGHNRYAPPPPPRRLPSETEGAQASGGKSLPERTRGGRPDGSAIACWRESSPPDIGALDE